MLENSLRYKLTELILQKSLNKEKNIKCNYEKIIHIPVNSYYSNIYHRLQQESHIYM
jgi:hypothetical protein